MVPWHVSILSKCNLLFGVRCSSTSFGDSLYLRSINAQWVSHVPCTFPNNYLCIHGWSEFPTISCKLMPIWTSWNYMHWKLIFGTDPVIYIELTCVSNFCKTLFLYHKQVQIRWLRHQAKCITPIGGLFWVPTKPHLHNHWWKQTLNLDKKSHSLI